MINKHATDKELKDLGILPKYNDVNYVDKSGKSCDSNDAVAKIVNFIDESNPSNISLQYHIKYRRGQLFDPYGIDALKINAYDTKYKKVDEKIYNKYIKYLATRRSTFLLEATRDFISKGY